MTYSTTQNGMSTPSQSAPGSDGCLTGSDGCVTGSDGCVTGSDECLTGSDGCLTGSDGCVTGSDGCLTGSDGCVIDNTTQKLPGPSSEEHFINKRCTYPDDRPDDRRQSPDDRQDDRRQSPDDRPDDRRQSPDDRPDDRRQSPDDRPDDRRQYPDDRPDDRRSSTGQESRVFVPITIILVCYVMTFISLAPLSTQYFTFRLVSNNLTAGPSADHCSNVSVQQHEPDVQRRVADMSLYATLSTGLPAAVCLLFMGSCSDYVGRKPLLVATLLGGTTRVASLALIILFDLDLEWYFLGSALDGLAGSFYALSLSVTVMIVDATPTHSRRAVSLAYVEGVLLVFGALSQVGMGYLIQEVGYLVPALVCCGCSGLALLATCCLPETLGERRQLSWSPWKHITQTFGFYCSDGRKRNLFLFGLGAYLSLTMTNIGRQSVETLYELARPLCWTSVDIGIYSCSKMIVQALAAVLFLKILKGRVTLEVTGMLCTLSAVLGFLLEAFSTSTLWMYISAAGGVLYLAAIPIPRALVSTLVNTTQLGALFSSLATLEVVSNMSVSLLYTFIYNNTLSSFRGAVFTVMAALCLVCFVMLGLFLRCKPRLSNKSLDDLPHTSHVISVEAELGADERSPLLKN